MSTAHPEEVVAGRPRSIGSSPRRSTSAVSFLVSFAVARIIHSRSVPWLPSTDGAPQARLNTGAQTSKRARKVDWLVS